MKRWRRPTRWPPPAESFLSAVMIDGRLKRNAGSAPSTTLVTRHSPMHCSTSHGSGLNRSSAGFHVSTSQAITIGPPKRMADASVPPSNASTSASLKW